VIDLTTACKKRKDEESSLLNDCLHEKVEKVVSPGI
jgi:hypothetical protein